jgi:hypothetical protein
VETKPGSRPLSLSGARVKGLAFRSVLEELDALEGPGAVERALALMHQDLAARLRTHGLSASGWHAVEDYADMWQAIQKATGERRELPRLIGRRAVEGDLNVVHKMVFKALSAATVIGLATRVFGAYYDTGKARADKTSDHGIRVWFTGCTGFTGYMWEELRGSVETFAEQASAAKAWSSWQSGGTDADRDAVLDVAWK